MSTMNAIAATIFYGFCAIPTTIQDMYVSVKKTFTHETTLSPEDRFRGCMMQRQYQHCMDMLLKDDEPLKLTESDYRRLTLLAKLEQDPHEKKVADTCQKFLYHYLEDHGVLTSSYKQTRGREEVEQFIRDLASVQGRLH